MSVRNKILDLLAKTHPDALPLIGALVQAIDLEKRDKTLLEDVKTFCLSTLDDVVFSALDGLGCTDATNPNEDHAFRTMHALFVDFETKGLNLKSLRTEQEILNSIEHLLHVESTPIRFSLYGPSSSGVTSTELIADADCIARVECSGSEGYYVEVAKWHDRAGWRRHAYYKFFGKHEAKYWADQINENSPAAFFHYLQNAPEESARPNEDQNVQPASIVPEPGS